MKQSRGVAPGFGNGDAVIVDRRRASVGDGVIEVDSDEDRVGCQLQSDAVRTQGGTLLSSTCDDCVIRAPSGISPLCWFEHLHTETANEEVGADTPAESTP